MATQAPTATRESLLRALKPVFVASGYDGATLTRLAAAADLGKASLYHHFPGGKAEMAAALLRDAVAELERRAFARLAGNQPPGERLARFVDGFRDYVADGESGCLILALSRGEFAATHAATVRVQYEDWIARLARTYQETGAGPRRASRLAADLLADLYGHLTIAQLLGKPYLFRKHVRRLRKRLAR